MSVWILLWKLMYACNLLDKQLFGQYTVNWWLNLSVHVNYYINLCYY